MIISDQHAFAFVHIPKCGGTSVRSQLAQIDDYKGAWDGSYLAHIPLSRLKEMDAEVYEKVRSYASFCIIRDPYERFSSSLRQNLVDTKRQYAGSMSDRELRTHMLEILDALKSGDPSEDRKLIHFTPQVDYIFDGGEKIVDNIYSLNEIGQFFEDVGKLTGLKLDTERHANRNLNFRYRKSAKLAYSLNNFLWKSISDKNYQKIKKIGVAMLTKKENLYQQSGLVEQPEVRDFIEHFYADDIAFYSQHTQGR